jgi:pilus assembly protein FimV
MSLASVSSESLAVGMGEIEIFSTLNQQLDAEISLVSVGPGELDGATVNLASEAAFSRAGLSLSPALRSLRFDIEQRPDGEPIIKVFSDAPVVEPFLNFLVELESPSVASEVREFTLLLDPPAFVTQQEPEVADPVTTLEPVVPTESIAIAPVEEVFVDNNPADSGAEIDLSSVLVEPVEPTVIFTEGEVLQLGRESEVAELPEAETTQINENIFVDSDAGGEEIDLGSELIDRTELVVEDETGGQDISLGEFAESAIFPVEEQLSADTDENIVDLGSIETDAVDALVNDVNQVSDELRQQGLDVDLNSVEPGVEGFEVETVQESDIPQVTLEPVETIALDSTGQGVTAQVPEEAIITSDDERTFGANVDLSAIDDSDASLPVVDNSVAVDSGDGESVDISGVVVQVEDDVTVDIGESDLIDSPVSSTYTVQSQDTLWSIARRSKPAGVSTPDMMTAILQANPEAFSNGDMNTLKEGATLTLPGSSTGVSFAPSQAIVQDNSTFEAAPVETVETAPVQTEEMVVTDDTTVVTDSTVVTEVENTGTQLSTNLDEVNKKMMLAQEELSSEAEQRDELSNRVVELEDSLTKMKELITLRESELTNLQTELTATPETGEPAAPEITTESAAPETTTEPDAMQGEREEIQDKFKELQEQINENTTLAQERVDAEADAERNLASAEAQAKSLRLANEEDALKIQLAQLRAEKLQLEETAQQDKLELVRQAEAEKAQLLENATAERDRILASLEDDKRRITEEAATERTRIAMEAEAEKERLVSEARAERDKIAAESEEMRSKLEALEEEKNQLIAQAEIDKEQLEEANRKAEEEQAKLQAEAEAEKKKLEEESSRAKDKLAELQAEADANLANNANNATIDRTASATESDSSMTDLAVPAAIGGGLAAAPLERVMGDRKKVLATGGGIALLGLLGAWALRRKKVAPVARRDVRDDRGELDLNEDRMGSSVATQFDNNRSTQYEDVGEDRPNMGRAAVAASAAAAATGAAVVSRDAASRSEEPSPRDVDHQHDARAEFDARDAQRVAQTEPSADAPEQQVAHPMMDEVLVDDTITEADVYLRYGLHGQAEDLLKAAIAKSPDVEEYQVKLLESYHDQKNTPEFKSAAESFKDRFGESRHWDHIAEMGRNLDSSDSEFSRVGALGAVAGVAGAATAAVASDKPDVEIGADVSDDTIDIDAEADFNVADLEATGDMTAVTDSLPDDLDEISLDEVDMAALDDDGTLNLEELAGDQMSGLDLGTLDLTNPVGDSTLDNLTLDDADLNELGDVTSNVRSGLQTDIDLDEGSISRTDEMETMLDLAKAYIDMGDSDSAEGALKDIVENGSDAQKMEAQDLLRKLR